jgi:hypothetical protein
MKESVRDQRYIKMVCEPPLEHHSNPYQNGYEFPLGLLIENDYYREIKSIQFRFVDAELYESITTILCTRPKLKKYAAWKEVRCLYLIYSTPVIHENIEEGHGKEFTVRIDEERLKRDMEYVRTEATKKAEGIMDETYWEYWLHFECKFVNSNSDMDFNRVYNADDKIITEYIPDGNRFYLFPE